MKSVLAVDVGGTKMAAGIVDVEGNLVRRVMMPTPQNASSDVLFSIIDSLISKLELPDDLVACGVGCGGPMRQRGREVSPLNIPGWRNFPLKDRVSALTGLETTVDNDAKAFALAEGWTGAARGQENFIGMVVSTGVGGGIVLNGRLLEGKDGNAGHIGHVVVEPQGSMPPGQIQGSLESECSGTSIAWRTGAASAKADLATVERTGRLVGRAVGSIANLLDLGLAVVGGSVALGFGDRFFASAQSEIDRVSALDYSRGMTIVPAGNGDASPLIGAGALAFRSLGYPLGSIVPA